MNENCNRLWYEQPANEWVEALPIGNGFIGAMGFGGALGLYELSENTCWSGKKSSEQLPKHAAFYMKKGREALSCGNIKLAHQMLEKCEGVKGNYGTQLPMGRLNLTINDDCVSQTRELNIEDGVLTDLLNFEGGSATRQMFASHEERCIRFRLSGNLPDMNINLEGHSNPSKQTLGDLDIEVEGIALENTHSNGLCGVNYKMILRLKTDGQTQWSRNGLHLVGASFVEGMLFAQTDFGNADIDALIAQRITDFSNVDYYESLKQHTASHRELMNRCELNLPKNENSHLPTDIRKEKFAEDNSDQALIALFFQYGRYLILDSSRENSDLPAALQGVWNDNRAAKMGWTDDMHLDINTQMNYFAVESTGLAECSMPLYNFLKDILMPSGEEIARSLYGVNGWLAHVVTNAHGFAAPGWSTQWGYFLTGGAWAALDIFRHYRYTLDRDFLAKYYPVLSGAARCLFELLEADPDTGRLLLNPSCSPENMFVIDSEPYALDRGTVVDSTVCRCLFEATVESARLLDSQDDFTDCLKMSIPFLPDYKIGTDGQLLEWQTEYEEYWPDHRHTSHLMSLYPFETIDLLEHPDLAAACERSIERRMETAEGDIVLTNWAANLLLLYYAKLRRSQNAAKLIETTITRLSRDNLMVTHDGPTTLYTGGIYELDGNTGLTAGICEMLLQSRKNCLRVFPCLPDEWECGEVKGIRAPGRLVLNLSWTKTSVTVSCDSMMSCVVYADKHVENVPSSVSFERVYTNCLDKN